jgi:hypothetical protein
VYSLGIVHTAIAIHKLTGGTASVSTMTGKTKNKSYNLESKGFLSCIAAGISKVTDFLFEEGCIQPGGVRFKEYCQRKERLFEKCA